METDFNLEAISQELDEVQSRARRAFLARDSSAYRANFTDDLRYVQLDGTSISLEQLMRDVSQQLSSFRSIESEFKRDSVVMNDDGTVTQIGHQRATFTTSVFLFFTKTWKIDREGRYRFRRVGDSWRICEVEVMSEFVK